MARSSLRGASILSLLGVLAQGGFRVIVNVLIGRFAGPVVLGQTAGVLAAAQLLTLLGPTSLAAAQTRYVAKHNQDPEFVGSRDSAVRHARQRSAQVGAGILVLATLVWGLGFGVSVQHIVTMLGLFSGLIAYGLTKSHMLGIGKIRRLAISEVCSAVAGVLLVLLLLYLGVRDIRLLWPVAFTAWFCAALTWVRVPHGSGSPLERSEMDRFARLGVLGTFVSAGFLQTSVLLATEGIGGAAAGQYAAAFALATPLSLLTTSMGLVLFPAFAAAASGDARSQLFRRSLDVMVFLIVPVFVTVMFLSPEVTTVVWGHGFETTAAILPILVCAVALLGVGMPGSQALTAAGIGGMRDSVRIGLVGAGSGVAIWVWAVPALGVGGIALGYLVGTLITSAGPLVIMGRRYRIPGAPMYLLRGWGIPVGAATFAVLCVQNNLGIPWRLCGLSFALGLWGLLALLHKMRGRVS